MKKRQWDMERNWEGMAPVRWLCDIFISLRFVRREREEGTVPN